MRYRTGPRRWSVADRISVVVLMAGALTVAYGWHSSAFDGGRHETIDQQTTATPVGCGGACGRALGLSGDPATGMPFAQ